MSHMGVTPSRLYRSFYARDYTYVCIDTKKRARDDATSLATPGYSQHSDKRLRNRTSQIIHLSRLDADAI